MLKYNANVEQRTPVLYKIPMERKIALIFRRFTAKQMRVRYTTPHHIYYFVAGLLLNGETENL